MRRGFELIVGVPREIKNNEYRVSMVPSGVRVLREGGYRVIVERGAGRGSGISDEEYVEAGAEIVENPEEVFRRADLIIKVKEPQKEEYRYLREGLILFSFLHLASSWSLTEVLLKSGVTAIAYETVQRDDGLLPILKPMSEIAGRLSVQAGAHYLLKPYGGRGVLLGGVPGVRRGSVAVIGAGTVGVNATRMAVGLGAEVTVLDLNLERFRYLDDLFGGRVRTLMSNSYNIETTLREADLLVGAVHLPGARTPRIVTRDMLSIMKKGSVIVDVSVDQGGCVETIRPTTHAEPVYEVDGIIHYGVSNIPGAVPETSTYALTNATLPYVLTLVRKGLKDAVTDDPSLRRGVNIHNGRITHRAVAEAFEKEYTPLVFT